MNDPSRLLDHLLPQRDAMVGVLRQYVELETPSDDKPALDRLADLIEARWRETFRRADRIANPSGGVFLLARFDTGVPVGAAPVLVLGHYDTVWPIGTLERMPFRLAEGRAYGPGTYDMKAGLVLLEFAIAGIRDLGLTPRRPIVALWTSDEETGSHHSRALIEHEAREASHVFVLEGTRPDGGLKTARKGVGWFDVKITGRAAHAGVEPEKGASAIHELAHQIVNITRLADPNAGTTINVGLIEGGTASNVVAGAASARVDVRVMSQSEAERVEAAIRNLTQVTPGTSIRVEGGLNRPPMERTPAIVGLFEQARAIGRELGIELTEGMSGGGSDGNFTAALGVPTLDGLGAVGGGAHAASEHIVIEVLPERAALLAALLLRV